MFCVLRTVFRRSIQVNCSVIRQLYSPVVLGITRFQEEQKSCRDAVSPDIQKTFLSRVEASVDKDGQIFTEDLKTLLLLAETEEHFQLVFKVIERYREQQKKAAFPSFFEQGKYLVCMFYVNNQVDRAFNWFLDEKCNVDVKSRHHICFLLMMDMLYEAGRYQDVVTLLANSEDYFHKRSLDITVIVLAALYKINTPASLSQTQSILNDLCLENFLLTTRCLFYCTLLAYNQGKPGLMLEMLELPVFHVVRTRIFSKCDNIRILAYIELGRVEEAVQAVKGILVNMEKSKPLLFLDTVEKLSEAVNSVDNFELKTNFKYIYKSLERGGFVASETLEDFVSLPVKFKEYTIHSKLEESSLVRIQKTT